MSWDNDRLLEYLESRGMKGQVSPGRKAGVLLSSVCHVVVLGLLLAAHLLAPVRDLPKLPTTTVFLVTPPPKPAAPPPPPPPPLRLPPAQALPQPEAARAEPLEPLRPPVTPVEEPEEEPGDVKFRRTSGAGQSGVADGAGAGEPGGAEGGVPGGVVGGLPSPAALAAEPTARPKPIRIPPTSRQAVPLVRVDPDYPDYAVKARVEGLVTLDVLVDEKGEPENVQVIRSHMLLETAALDAVKQWRWRPYLVDGRAIAFRVVVTIQFQLANRR